jgi:hypothetical protein
MTSAWLALLSTPTFQESAAGLIQRLGKSLHSFWFLLSHDTAEAASRDVMAPYLLAAWFAASIVASPLTLLVLKALRSNVDFKKVAGVAFGVALTQLAFFAVDWYVMQWGHRDVDQAVFCATLVPALLITKWGLSVSWPRALVATLAQAFFAFALVFLVYFAMGETGRA